MREKQFAGCFDGVNWKLKSETYQTFLRIQGAEASLKSQDEKQDRSHKAQPLVLLLSRTWRFKLRKRSTPEASKQLHEGQIRKAFTPATTPTNNLSHTYESQDAETQVMCNRGDNSTHPQHSERGVAAGDDQVTREIPEHIPAQQVTLKTVQSHRYARHLYS